MNAIFIALFALHKIYMENCENLTNQDLFVLSTVTPITRARLN